MPPRGLAESGSKPGSFSAEGAMAELKILVLIVRVLIAVFFASSTMR
jgi:hypothetical protein